MPSNFHARDAPGYERLMGRWSRRLAPLFIEHAGISDGERVLEVGCGTGSLTFALASSARLAELTAIDFAEVYVEAARATIGATSVRFEQGDACALRFADARFDRCLSMLVLHFVPDPEIAVAEMLRVTRSGGSVAAAVWDAGGGMPAQRMFWDTAAVLEPSAAQARAQALSRRIVGADGLGKLWRAGGLIDVDQRSLTIRMDYADFDDYWLPLLGGEGGIGAYVARLSEDRRRVLREHVRAAYLAGADDGARSFTATAWSCRGVVA